MSYLQKQMNFLRFDKRLLEINLKRGNITREEYDQHIQNLPDDEANSEKLELGKDEAESSLDTMNGGSHPADNEATQIPTNTDPFGSGF